MKNIFVPAVALLGSLLVIGGCSQEQSRVQGKEPVQKQAESQLSEQVKSDLANYLKANEQAMKPWSKIDGMAEQLKKAKSAPDYVAKLRKEFVPLVSGVVAQMEALKPATKEVQEIHAAYLSSIRDYLSGLQGMAEAVEKNDDVSVSVSAVKLNAFPLAHSKFLESVNLLKSRIAVAPKS
jgi:uncharacterized phage infection (PIP) family protein YhgE